MAQDALLIANPYREAPYWQWIRQGWTLSQESMPSRTLLAHSGSKSPRKKRANETFKPAMKISSHTRKKNATPRKAHVHPPYDSKNSFTCPTLLPAQQRRTTGHLSDAETPLMRHHYAEPLPSPSPEPSPEPSPSSRPSPPSSVSPSASFSSSNPSSSSFTISASTSTLGLRN